jgi:hypothetical protein
MATPLYGTHHLRTTPASRSTRRAERARREAPAAAGRGPRRRRGTAVSAPAALSRPQAHLLRASASCTRPNPAAPRRCFQVRGARAPRARPDTAVLAPWTAHTVSLVPLCARATGSVSAGAFPPPLSLSSARPSDVLSEVTAELARLAHMGGSEPGGEPTAHNDALHELHARVRLYRARGARRPCRG